MSKKTTTTKRARKFSQDFSGDSVTQQHFKSECDVNNIVAHYTQTGIDPNPERRNQGFGFATSQDFRESAFAMAEVNSAFASLPSSERSQHKNDPAVWLDHIAKYEAPEEPLTPVLDPSEPATEPPKTEPLDIT